MLRYPISILRAMVALMVALHAGAAAAATVTGDVAWGGEFAETTSSINLKYADDTPYSDLKVLLVCLDVTLHAPDDGPVSFNTNAGSSVLSSGAGEIGVAAIHWLFDHYYVRYLKNGSYQQQWAFQYAVWEVAQDFTGDVSSISASEGRSKPVQDSYFGTSAEDGVDDEFVLAYETIYQGLVNALSTLRASYRSSTLTLDFFANNNPADQDMVAVVERRPPSLSPVPLDVPIALMSLLMAALAFGVKRRLG